MKMIYTIVLVVLSIFSLHTTPAYGQEQIVKKDELENILIFPVLSEVGIIKNRDEGIRLKDLSVATEKQIIEHLGNYMPAEAKSSFLTYGEFEKQIIYDSCVHLINEYLKAQFPKRFKSPKFLLDILKTEQKDYGLFLYHGGYTRTTENLKKEIARVKKLSLYTLGFYGRETYETYSLMICILFERKTGKVVKYEVLRFPDKNPNIPYIIRTQIRHLLALVFP